MQYTANWGPKGFVVSANKIVPLMDLKSSVSVRTETQTDASGTSQTNQKGRELQKITLSTIYLRAAGVDPRAQVEEWEALVGQSHPLMIGGRRFGPAKMMLKGVNSDLTTGNDGTFLQADVAFTFEEYTDTPAATVSATASTAAATYAQTVAAKKAEKAEVATSATAKTAATTYAETVAKKKALSTGASTSDKAAKKSGRVMML